MKLKKKNPVKVAPSSGSKTKLRQNASKEKSPIPKSQKTSKRVLVNKSMPQPQLTRPKGKIVEMEDKDANQSKFLGNLKRITVDVYKKRKYKNEEFEKIQRDKSKHKALPVRLPWVKKTTDVWKEKKAAIEKNIDVLKGEKLMRIKFPDKHYACTVGVGYPSRGLIYANLEIARGTKERKVLERTPSGRPTLYEPLEKKIPGPVSDKVFKEYCTRMGIGVYEGEPNIDDPLSSKAIDLTLFDLYWEDIKIEKDVLLRELRFMPLKKKVELIYLSHFEKSMYHLARSCYFSPGYTHKKCEDVIHIFLWLLNRRNLPLVFHIKVMQCLSLVIYSSPVFKLELVKCGGVNILVRVMQIGMVFCGLQASWAVYCLTMAAIGSPEVIQELKKQKDIDERVGEMTFHMFWYHWPTNFGMILQSLLFGPGGVANMMDTFQFL